MPLFEKAYKSYFTLRIEEVLPLLKNKNYHCYNYLLKMATPNEQTLFLAC